MLSEKAKGKQRAAGPLDEPPEIPESKTLVIRFTEGIPDLTLQVGNKDAVRDLKRNARRASCMIISPLLTMKKDSRC